MGSNIVQSAKGLGLEQNVIIRVIDPASNEIVSEHIGHNNVTNTFLTGIAHYITGDGVFNAIRLETRIYLIRHNGSIESGRR